MRVAIRHLRRLRNRRPGQSSRRGAIYLEFLLVFPILFIATLALFEFLFVALIMQAVTATTLEAAREAAKVGATPSEVEQVVAGYLGIHNLAAGGTLDSTSNGLVHVLVERPVSGDYDLGNTAIPCFPQGGVLPPSQTRVTISVRLTDDQGKRPVPNMLRSFGFDLGSSRFELSSKETLE